MSPLCSFDIMAQWNNRAAVAFAAMAWMLAGIAANITVRPFAPLTDSTDDLTLFPHVQANSISCANDMVTLAPKYINITRGQLITAVLGGWAVAPWKILSSNTTFLSFISGYAIFLGPFSAFITADYFLVKRRAYHVPELYDPRGIYSYWHGTNWRAVATLILTVPPNLPGLINAINSDIDIGGIKWYYAPGFIVSRICLNHSPPEALH